VTGNRPRAWHGNAALEPMLVRVAELRPHPKNPRRGVVDEIARSLARFGQQRPILALPDGTIVAGHHVWQAAKAEQWTHVAVVRSDLSEREVDAYLLADNRLADLGLYDDQALAELLEPLARDDLLDGIGYSGDDLTALLAYLEPATLGSAPAGGTPATMPYATGEAELFRIVLTYDQETYERIVAALDAVAEAEGVDSYSEAVEVLALATDRS
jgi:ParB-like chromosome segregation protein Spo0J